MATLSDYENERSVFGTIILQAFEAYGAERTLEMMRGVSDACHIASRCIRAGLHLVHTKPTNNDGVAA